MDNKKHKAFFIMLKAAYVAATANIIMFMLMLAINLSYLPSLFNGRLESISLFFMFHTPLLLVSGLTLILKQAQYRLLSLTCLGTYTYTYPLVYDSTLYSPIHTTVTPLYVILVIGTITSVALTYYIKKSLPSAMSELSFFESTEPSVTISFSENDVKKYDYIVNQIKLNKEKGDHNTFEYFFYVELYGIYKKHIDGKFTNNFISENTISLKGSVFQLSDCELQYLREQILRK